MKEDIPGRSWLYSQIGGGCGGESQEHHWQGKASEYRNFRHWPSEGKLQNRLYNHYAHLISGGINVDLQMVKHIPVCYSATSIHAFKFPEGRAECFEGLCAVCSLDLTIVNVPYNFFFFFGCLAVSLLGSPKTQVSEFFCMLVLRLDWVQGLISPFPSVWHWPRR